MPEVKPPRPQPIESDIELFAKAYFNIHLTRLQREIIHNLAYGKPMRPAKRIGLSTALKVFRAYIDEGLKPGGRVRLPKHPLPPIDKKQLKGLTQEGRILALISRPGGAYNYELSRFALKYTSVISALRKDGHNIPPPDRQYLKNGRASNTYRYRLGGQ